jgi:hypothetical protein
MLAQASTGLIETWWVAKLGTDALVGMALEPDDFRRGHFVIPSEI